jgi:flagellar basal body rod protein FlgC
VTKDPLSGVTFAENSGKQNLLLMKINSQHQHSSDKSYVILLIIDFMDEIANKISTTLSHEANATAPYSPKDVALKELEIGLQP